jgi:hypothetical protein
VLTLVGKEPTATAGDGVDVATDADEWGGGGTPSGTSKKHYEMELPRTSSSWSPCGHGSCHPR